MCKAYNDEDGSGVNDRGSSSCGIVVTLVEGSNSYFRNLNSNLDRYYSFHKADMHVTKESGLYNSTSFAETIKMRTNKPILT